MVCWTSVQHTYASFLLECFLKPDTQLLCCT